MALADSLRAALLDRLAVQWVALGVPLVGPAEASPIDLEALVVATALFGQGEPRLYEGALDWCAQHGTAISGGRLRVVAAELEAEPAVLETFAARVAGGGGPHWPSAAGRVLPHTSRGAVQQPDLRSPALLAWRLRSAFGVAARADILVILATSRDQAFGLADLAKLTRSTKRTVTLAVRSLALGGVAEVTRIRNEQRVRLTRHLGFRDWLGSSATAAIDWTARFAVVGSVLRVEHAEPTSALVGAIEARMLVERLSPAIRQADLPMPDTTQLGEAFGPEFRRWRGAVARVISP